MNINICIRIAPVVMKDGIGFHLSLFVIGISIREVLVIKGRVSEPFTTQHRDGKSLLRNSSPVYNNQVNH